MLANQIGYFSLILGLFFSFLLSIVSIKSLYDNNKVIDYKVLSLTFLQFLFVLISFLGLILLIIIVKMVSLIEFIIRIYI